MIKELEIPNKKLPIVEIPIVGSVQLFMKREDLVHPEISGNKYWKLLHNVNNYIRTKPKNPLLISFGGAYSNHIAALAAFGKQHKIPTLGIIRGEEIAYRWQDNPTLFLASENGMAFRFVSRDEYRNKKHLTEELEKEFPEALVVPEGGTNENAVKGIQNMLNADTRIFDYLCTAVGTGGTVSGISKFADEHQKVLGFKVVADDSLQEKIAGLSGKENFNLIEAHFGGYGKISDAEIRFINEFYCEYNIPLDPIYTGKMMMALLEMIEDGFFPKGSKILAFHTGGLQGINGVNQMLKKQGKTSLNFELN
ncbi:MAG: pyridoxal-phosphate dependent enzyme [Cruoricaptor ignavus]|nr:pyridoxal-phosphate dependent enzyme [Cruoricaptor ignavus]MDO5616936.1 pyridoxal-phosphate dependent enzyme [Cruoricaptor ignavus]